MKRIFNRMLCFAAAILMINFPVFSQCTVTISGGPCTGNTLTANFTGGTPDTLKWKLNGVVVHIETRNGFSQDGITVAGGNGAGNALNQLLYPHDVFVDNAGNLFVADASNGRVTKWALGATSGTIVATGLGFPTGVHVDASGNVYAADRTTHQVTKWAPGAISGVVVAGGKEAGDALNQLNGANDVYVDNSGNIFVADRGNNRIMKWAPGASSGVIVAGGNGPGSALNQLNSPTYVGLDAAGNLYVSDRENDRVLKFPPGSNAGTNGVIVAGGNGPGDGLNQIDGAEGLFITPDGTVYVTSEDDARIMKWSPGATEGVVVAGGNGHGSLPNQFLVAVGVCLDAQGNMYVGDAYNHRVQKFTLSTGVITTTFTPTLAGTYTVTAVAEGCEATSDPIVIEASTPEGVTVAGGNGRGSGANQLAQPNGLFVDKKGNLWVADTHNGRVQKFTPGSTNGITIGGNLPNKPGFPTNVFVCPRGFVYVADYFASRVVRLAKNGTAWITVATGMDLTRGVWVDKYGNVYATDYGNNRILKFTPGSKTGVVVAGGNGYGNKLNQLARPVSVFVDHNGNVFVSDQDNDRIVKWKPGATKGIIVAGGNGTGNAANQLNQPDFVFVDSNRNVYVTDRNNDRIQKWTQGASSGITVAGGNGTGNAANQFNQPYGGMVDANGYLFVADHENDRVQRFDLNQPTCGHSLVANANLQSAGEKIIADQNRDETAKNQGKFSVYPNPAINTATVVFTSAKQGYYILEITDLTGKALFRKKGISTTGRNTLNIDLNNYSKGMYLINIMIDGKSRQIMKLVKQ